MTPTTLEQRLLQRKQLKAAPFLARRRFEAQARIDRMAVRKAMRILKRACGDERDPVLIARALYPGGVFQWRYDKYTHDFERGRSACRFDDGPRGRRLFARCDDDGDVVGDSLERGIAMALFYACGFRADGHFYLVDSRNDAILAAVVTHCEARDA